MRKLTDWLRGGSDELGYDDLIRRITQAVAPLAHHAERGHVSFPAEVTVRIVVGEGSVQVIEEFLDRPALDGEVASALANRCDCDPAALPARDYVVSAGSRTTVTATEGTARVWELVIDGGDRSGRVLALPSGSADLRFGRGPWHGGDRHIRNDLVVCDDTEFVSRRAGRFSRTGQQLHVYALDQGDALVVHRAAGDALRPARTARGHVVVRPGDVIELGDGRGNAVRLLMRRTPRVE